MSETKLKSSSCAYRIAHLIKPAAALLASLAATFLVARNILFQNLVFGDTPWVNLQSPQVMWQYCFNIWTPAAYGDNTPKPQCYLLMYIFAKIASAFGNPVIYGFILQLSLPLSFLSFYFYSKKFSQNILTRILGASFYLVNPVALAYFAAGAFMWTMVFLPLSLNYFIELLEEQKMKNTLKATLFTSLTVWTLPSIALILFLGLLTIALSYVVTAKNRRDYVGKLWTQLVIYGLLLVSCSAPYIYSTAMYVQSPSFNTNSGVLSDFQYTYQEATIPNLLRLAGNEGSPQKIFGYNSSGNLSNEVGYVIPLLAFASIMWLKGSDKKRRLVAMLTLLCFTLFSALFLRFACNTDLKWVITDIMIVWTLRNPFKIQLLMLTAVTPPFIFTAEKLSHSSMKFLRRRNFMLAIATMALAFLAVSHIYFYNSFAFNGYMGLDKHLGLKQATVDENLSCIVNDSSSLPDIGSFRGLILPFDHKTELHVEWSNMFLYPSRLGQNSIVSEEIGKALSGGVNLENLLRLFSIKYVYVNNKWEDTGYYIIQPKNPQAILALLNETCEKASKGEYCFVTVENVLPTIYISQYPIFCSNIETIKLFDASTFQRKPVFIEIKEQGCTITTEDGKLSKTFHYAFENPYPAIYHLYVIGYVEKPEASLYYRLDDGELMEKHVFEGENPLKDIVQLQLQTGSHSLSLTVDGVDTFTDLNPSFINYGNGTYSVERQKLKIKNGALIGLKEFENFDLTLKFKAVNYGEETWHGPYVYFSFTEDSYYRVIFHENGYVELAKYAQGQHHSFLALKHLSVNFKEWNKLRLVKASDTVNLYLNDQYIFSFEDPMLNITGKIGLGSYCSTTIFDEVSISPNVVRGVWLIPEENTQTCSAKILETASGCYTLQVNNSENSWLALFLGENFDPLWEAAINGTTDVHHLRGNYYGNLWVFNASKGLLNIEIRYNPNLVYKYLFSISLIVETALMVAVYLPFNILQKYLRKTRKHVAIHAEDTGLSDQV